MKNMKNLLFAVALIFGVSTLTIAQDAVMSDADKANMHAEMMKKFEEYSTPNENHKVLDYFVGNWEYTSKMWMDPTAEPEVTSGTAMTEWILGGRFVHQNFMGQHMGKPFNGIEITGYDNAKKEYVSTWIDDMGTGMITSKKGSYDASTKTMTQEADFLCPVKGQMTMRWVTKIIDDNTYSFEMYGNEGGKEMKGMEIIYKRK